MPKLIRRAGAAGLVALLATGLVTGTGSAPASAAPVLYEAERASIVNGVVESNHAGFTGEGFVNSANAVGASIEFIVGATAAGSRTLIIRYANGTTSNRPGRITINGTTHSTPAFPPTGSWSTWSTQTFTAVLSQGSALVRITSTTAGGLGNIDSLSEDDGAPVGPISDPIPENPIPSGLGLTLTQFTQFPQSTAVPTPTDPRLSNRRARINFIGQVPGSTRLFTPDLNGKLYFVPPTGGTPTTYLDVGATVGSNFWSGRGLGSGFGFVAFHPDFATNGRFYTTHSEAAGALTSPSTRPDWNQANAVVHSVLTEWTATNPAAATFSGTRRQLVRIGFAAYIHAIQQIDFDSTARPGDADYGLLYLAVGDGGIGYTTTVPQDLQAPYGKILRIDPRGTNSPNGRYGIPAGNPFVGRPGALGELYAVGMRDPHRFSWDATTRRLFLGHIGEHDIEAVVDVRAGDNLGWSEREGAFVFNREEPCNLYPLPANDAQFGYVYPVAAYDHNAPPGHPCGADVGRAISGGFVYRGNALPALRGKYIFGDLVDGRVFYTNESQMIRGGPLAPLYQLQIFNASGTQVTMADLAVSARVDLRFGVDRAGELYLLSKANGRVWKVTATRGSAP